MSFFETLIISPRLEFLAEASHKLKAAVCINGLIYEINWSF